MNKIIQIVLLLNLDIFCCVDVCNNWVQYKDIKCIKVLEKKATEEVALKYCTQFDKSSTLLTIHSKDEQEYLNYLLVKYNNISLTVWLGMKYKENAFKCMDGSETNFTNWSDDTVKDGSLPCVQMSLVKSNLGKWNDQSCKKTALIVCEMKQDLILNKMHNDLDKQGKLIRRLENEINEMKLSQINSIIPNGFLYTQLPNQSSPLELWPNLKWIEVTKDYSGLFFRAEGGESEAFGKIQQANQSWISHVYFVGCYYDSWNNGHCDDKFTSINREDWVDVAHHSFNRAAYNLQFYTTAGEVRPKNTAIKIFKRIH